jgi:hypothetical protein
MTIGGDRPTIETFIGMHRAGIEITVICPADHPNYQLLENAGVPLLELPLDRSFDADGIRKLREELIRGRYDIMHVFNSRALTNGLRACRGLSIKVIAYRGIVGNLSFLDPMSWMRYLNPRVGYKSNAPAYSGASDVFCLPSTKREGLARAIIEVMMYGVAARDRIINDFPNEETVRKTIALYEELVPTA